jgi:ring-1,2-phenylacetyl-CoA epoxidase subunit PaaC
MQRLKKGFEEMWPYTGELFEMNEVEELLVPAGIAVDLAKIKPIWDREVKALLEEAGLMAPENCYMQTGSRKGYHSEHLGHLLAEMQAVPRMYPEAKW